MFRESNKKLAFTLAEVLITLGIIGVVAAITVPTLLQNINTKVKATRVETIKRKISDGTNNMMLLTTLNGYSSSFEFVNELKNHIKTLKVCDSEHIAECWPTQKVTINNSGKQWDISRTKTAKSLKVAEDETTEYIDTAGLLTADGVSIILTYNRKCNIDKYAPITWSGSVSSTTGCIGMIFDHNGAKEPNKVGDDIIALNSEGLGCALEVGSSCLSIRNNPTPLTSEECESMKSSLGIRNCSANLDYWAGAIKACGGASKMASSADLAMIATQIYGQNIGTNDRIFSGLNFNLNIAQQLGFSNYGFAIWAPNENNSEVGLTRNFLQSASATNWTPRSDSSILYICKVED